ncbi:MAG: hypothetical protein HOP29_16040 [Phycisphaerales bacterium]|nr:hypothetical protein [Phycisphaerales bacterium]
MKCRGRLRDGRPCPFSAERGRDYCFRHDPSDYGRRRRAEARRKGGLHRRKYVPVATAPVRLKTVGDFADFAVQIVHSMAARRLDEESGLIMCFALVVAIRMVAFRDKSELPQGLDGLGQRAERFAYPGLMKIADKSERRLEGIAPIALRLIDTIDARKVHRRRWESRRKPRIRRPSPNPAAREKAAAARRAEDAHMQRLLR